MKKQLKQKRRYLSLNERLSQLYFNKYTVALLLIIIKIHFYKKTIVLKLENHSSYELCVKEIEEFNDNIVVLINKIIVNNLNHLRTNFIYMIKNIITIIKNLILFYIEIFIGTYVCFLNSLIKAAVGFGMDAVENVLKFFNNSIDVISKELESGLNDISFFINHFLYVFSKIKSFFNNKSYNSEKYVDRITLSIKNLKKISIPESFFNDIKSFRENDFKKIDELENPSKTFISMPFDSLKNRLSQELEKKIIFDSIHLKNVLDLDSINAYCLNFKKIDEFHSNVKKKIDFIEKIIVFLLLLTAFFVIIPVTYSEYRKWRREVRLVEDLKFFTNESKKHIHNIINTYNNPTLYYIHKLKLSDSNSLFWFISYTTSTCSNNLFFIGIMYFMSLFFQFIMINLIEKYVKTKKLVNLVDFDVLFETSKNSYITQTNNYLSQQEKKLNQQIFNDVKVISLNLNSAVVNLTTKINEIIASIFGKSIFKKPVDLIFYCTIGRKLDKLESGLNWIQNKLKFHLPLFKEEIDDALNSLIKKFSKLFDTSKNFIYEKIISEYKRFLNLEIEIGLAILTVWLAQIIIAFLVIYTKKFILKKSKFSVYSTR